MLQDLTGLHVQEQQQRGDTEEEKEQLSDSTGITQRSSRIAVGARERSRRQFTTKKKPGSAKRWE